MHVAQNVCYVLWTGDHMTESPENPGRVDAILAAPVGRRLVAEVAGVQFADLLDTLALPYPSNIGASPTRRPDGGVGDHGQCSVGGSSSTRSTGSDDPSRRPRAPTERLLTA